jgi:hypothetical protein
MGRLRVKVTPARPDPVHELSGLARASPLARCSRRRTEGKESCDEPYLPQERLEDELLEVLKAMALPKGVAEAVDAAVAEMQGNHGRKSRQVSLKTIEDRRKRVNGMYKPERITRVEYDSECGEIDAQRKRDHVVSPQPLFVRQRTLFRTMVEDWAHSSS